jgi:dTDP-4-amino-4,6-dideoxygalactose transaminase
VLVDPDSGWSRDALMAALRDEGVTTSVHFRALHLMRYYADRFAFRPGMFPVAEMVAERTLSLPLSAGMSDEQVERVVAVVSRTLRRQGC